MAIELRVEAGVFWGMLALLTLCVVGIIGGVATAVVGYLWMSTTLFVLGPALLVVSFALLWATYAWFTEPVQ